MDMGVAVWLADCWPNLIVHAHVGLVTVDRPYLLRLDRRHNKAESDQQVICKAGAFCDDKSGLANGREHQYVCKCNTICDTGSFNWHHKRSANPTYFLTFCPELFYIQSRQYFTCFLE
jgi:hypothetical protein